MQGHSNYRISNIFYPFLLFVHSFNLLRLLTQRVTW